MYLYLKLNCDTYFFIAAVSRFGMNSPTFDYSVGWERGTFCVHWNADYLLEKLPPKTTKILSTRNSSMAMMSTAVYLIFELVFFFTKKISSQYFGSSISIYHVYVNERILHDTSSCEPALKFLAGEECLYKW